MALTRALGMGAMSVFVAACSPFGGGAFHCETSDQCAGGTCEPSGSCSFPDGACASGRRYGELSGSLSNTCVDDEGPSIDGPPPDDAPIDEAPPDDVPPDMPVPPAFCDTNDPTLVGCWQFEDNTNDASGDNNNATATNVTYTTGRVGQAVVLQANSLLSVGDRASLEPAHLSVEGWFRPAATPPAGPGRWGIIDSDGAYGIFINATSISCLLGGTLTVTTTWTIDTWKHVACTTDGATLRVYLDGVALPATATGGPLGGGNTNGTVLAGNSPNGDTFVGAVDQLRVFSEPRSATQICEAAGLALCPLP